jgi:hypothetical protein
MADSASSHHVSVTAQERVHPAVAKLARACLALARLKLVRSAPAESDDDLTQPPARANGRSADDGEVRHD